MRRLLACILVLCALAGVAQATDYGQSYDRFQTLYSDNLDFITINTGRHLMQLTFKGEFNSQGERIYVLNSGALSAEVKLDAEASYVASCRITLTAPSGMQYGDAQHNDFIISGYHSYALLMAMHYDETPYERYELVEEVNNALAAADTYVTQVGDYRLTCTRSGDTATMLFENDLFLGHMPEIPEEESEEELPDIQIKN